MFLSNSNFNKMLITCGDIIDLFYGLIEKRRFGSLLARISMPAGKRTKTWWNDIASDAPRNMWSIPAVIRRWQEKISGDPYCSMIEYVASRWILNHKKVLLLSPGCGDGDKECSIALKYPQWEITGFDISEKRINNAIKNARERRLRNVRFFVDDIYSPASINGRYDMVFFDSSLHHFSAFEKIFSWIKEILDKDGLLLINEYVGPDRFQWTGDQLRAANIALNAIRPAYRTLPYSGIVKKKIYRPGILRMILSDPSEAVQSSKIVSAVNQYFNRVKEVGLGGNIIHLVLKDIAHHFTGADPTAEAILQQLFATEDSFLQTHASDFIFGVYC